MRALFAAVAVLMFWCAPVQAQTGVPSTPAPTPLPQLPNDMVNQVVDTAVRGAESIGATAFVAVIVAMISLLVVLIAGYLLVRVGIMPLLNLIRDERIARREEREERIAKDRELAEYRERQLNAEERRLEVQAQQAEQFKTTVTKVIAMETKQEASDGRNQAVTTINLHTDEALRLQLEGIERLLTRALKGVNFVQAKNEQRKNEQHETADLTLPQVQTTLIEAQQQVQQVKKLHDTGKLTSPDNDKHKPED